MDACDGTRKESGAGIIGTLRDRNDSQPARTQPDRTARSGDYLKDTESHGLCRGLSLMLVAKRSHALVPGLRRGVHGSRTLRPGHSAGPVGSGSSSGCSVVARLISRLILLPPFSSPLPSDSLSLPSSPRSSPPPPPTHLPFLPSTNFRIILPNFPAIGPLFGISISRSPQSSTPGPIPVLHTLQPGSSRPYNGWAPAAGPLHARRPPLLLRDRRIASEPAGETARFHGPPLACCENPPFC